MRRFWTNVFFHPQAAKAAWGHTVALCEATLAIYSLPAWGEVIALVRGVKEKM
jgi:hypothetical protein